MKDNCGTAKQPSGDRSAGRHRTVLALIVIVQLGFSWTLCLHLADQLNPDSVAYGRAAQLWLRGDVNLALNATWGVLCPWLAVPGLALGLDPPEALRAGQVVAAAVATVGTDALLRCFRLSPLCHFTVLIAAALYAATASTIVLTSDASFVAVFVWMSWALLTHRTRVAGLPRPAFAGVLAGVSFLARPVGFPLGIALVAGTETMRTFADGCWSRGRRAAMLAAGGWALIAVPWILMLSVHYGKLTISHSPAIVHAAVGPRTIHPWNLPNFTHLHRPPSGRVTTWEDPILRTDPNLDWSPIESRAAWVHQIELVRRNLGAIGRELVGFDGIGLVLASLVLVPFLGLVRPRAGVQWREPWLLFCLILNVLALAPLHVERRYLWPLIPVSYAALGSLVTRIGDGLVRRGRPLRILTAIASLVFLLPAPTVNAVRAAAILTTPARRERRVAEEWAEQLRVAGDVGPVVSWSPYGLKTLDAEGLYLAWILEVPWLGNMAADGEDLTQATALGARVVVIKTGASENRPTWLDGTWTVLLTTDVRGDTLRDGRYFVLVRRPGSS